MKQETFQRSFVCLALAFLLVVSQQVFAQDADTLDVPQGYETLNLAVSGDTTATGQPKNLNRVYRLERGGWYLLNGPVGTPKDAPLRIVAKKGDGPKPMLIPAVMEAGFAQRAFLQGGDGEWRDLYVSGIDNLGDQAKKNMFFLTGEETRHIIDNCFLDYDAQAFVRMGAPNQKLFVTNTIMRNALKTADPWEGIFIGARGGIQDTIFVQNSTFYTAQYRPVHRYGGILKNVIFDHVTVYQLGGVGGSTVGSFNFERVINLTFTNNLIIDLGVEADPVPKDPDLALADSLDHQIVPIDSLKADSLAAEDQRNILIKNNVYGWTPEVLNWINTTENAEVKLKPYVFHNVRTLRIINTFPKMVSENNIEEYPVFTDAPDPATIIAYANHRFTTNYSDENNPSIAADRNGTGDLAENPTSMGPAEDEYDFDYSTTSQAYTHAEGGFPVGDLNWWPQKKSEWEAWVKTAVAFKGNSAPRDFTLKQNYPNPFNPSTMITYQLDTPSVVKLTVYNAIGQKVRTLVDAKRQNSGTHSVQWDGLDDANQPVASGVYIYRLQAGNQVQMKKMMLMK